MNLQMKIEDLEKESGANNMVSPGHVSEGARVRALCRGKDANIGMTCHRAPGTYCLPASVINVTHCLLQASTVKHKSIKQKISQAHHQSNQTIIKERKRKNPKHETLYTKICNSRSTAPGGCYVSSSSRSRSSSSSSSSGGGSSSSGRLDTALPRHWNCIGISNFMLATKISACLRACLHACFSACPAVCPSACPSV